MEKDIEQVQQDNSIPPLPTAFNENVDWQKEPYQAESVTLGSYMQVFTVVISPPCPQYQLSKFLKNTVKKFTLNQSYLR